MKNGFLATIAITAATALVLTIGGSSNAAKAEASAYNKNFECQACGYVLNTSIQIYMVTDVEYGTEYIVFKSRDGLTSQIRQKE